MAQTTQESLPQLFRELAEDARELVRAEVGVAKDELAKTLRALLVVIAGATAATVLAALSICSLLAVAVLLAGGTAAAALAAAAGLGLLMVLAAVLVSVKMLARSGAAKPATAPAEQPQPVTQQSEALQ